MQFFLSTSVELGVAFFVWRSIFESSGALRDGVQTGTVGGYTFSAMLYYVLVASQSMRASRGTESRSIAEDIYTGGLNRYLVYPVPLFRFKYLEHLAGQLMRLFQMAIVVGLGMVVFGDAPQGALTPSAILLGTGALLIAGLLHFQLLLSLELVAFWQDVVWNLLAMLRFMVQLLGGALVPLSLFPDWGRALVRYTPFPLLVSFPARCFLGQVTLAEWIQTAGIAALWALTLGMITRAIWERGARQYAGTGI